MGLRVQSTVSCFPELCFLQFPVTHALVGLRKQFINNFVFPTFARATGFNKKFNNNCAVLNNVTDKFCRRFNNTKISSVRLVLFCKILELSCIKKLHWSAFLPIQHFFICIH